MGRHWGLKAAAVGFAMGIASVVSGSLELQLALNNTEPLVVSCEELINKVPEREWVTLTGCQLDISQSHYFMRDKNSGITDLYVPLTTQTIPSVRTRVLIHSTKEEWLNLFSELKSAEGERRELDKFLALHQDRLIVRTEFSGLVEKGVNADSVHHRKLGELNGDAKESLAIVRLQRIPDRNGSIAMIIVGILLAAFCASICLRRFRRWKDQIL